MEKSSCVGPEFHDQSNQTTSRTCSGPCSSASVRITSQTGVQWVPGPATALRLRVPDLSVSSQSAAANSAQLINVVPCASCDRPLALNASRSPSEASSGRPRSSVSGWNPKELRTPKRQASAS